MEITKIRKIFGKIFPGDQPVNLQQRFRISKTVSVSGLQAKQQYVKINCFVLHRKC